MVTAQHAPSSPANSTNVRPGGAPLRLRLLRAGLGLTGRLAPAVAGAWAERLFFRPVVHSAPAREKDWLARAERRDVTLSGQTLASYAWGAGPPVLLVHGWSGRA